MRKILIVAFSAALCVPGLPVCAQAGELGFRVENDSKISMTELRVSPSGTSSWGGNLLTYPIPAGSHLDLQRSNGPVCKYDFRFELKDGTISTVPGIDMCREDSVSWFMSTSDLERVGDY